MPTDDEGLLGINPEELMLKPAFTMEEQIHQPDVVEKSGPDEVSAFDQRYRDPFTGLLYLGKLTDDVTILGHTFSIETPTQNERLESGILHKKYLNSISSEIGWAAITVATYLKKVDGTDLPQPIGPADTGIRDRFNWVIENLRGPVIQRVYEQCLVLDDQVNKCIEELESLGGF